MELTLARILVLLGISLGVVLIRLFVGFGFFTGPDVKYILNSERPFGKRLGLFALQVVAVFILLLVLMLWYRETGLFE